MITYNNSNDYVSDGDKDHELYLLFSNARYLTFQAREKELQRYRLTPEQAQVLFTIKTLSGRATPAELSRVLLRQPHTVSALVERMEQKGLVKKFKDLGRKNLVRVVLTEQGEKAYEVTAKRGPIHRILGNLTEEEREYFQRSLGKILEKARMELGMGHDKLPASEEH